MTRRSSRVRRTPRRSKTWGVQIFVFPSPCGKMRTRWNRPLRRALIRPRKTRTISVTLARPHCLSRCHWSPPPPPPPPPRQIHRAWLLQTASLETLGSRRRRRRPAVFPTKSRTTFARRGVQASSSPRSICSLRDRWERRREGRPGTRTPASARPQRATRASLWREERGARRDGGTSYSVVAVVQ